MAGKSKNKADGADSKRVFDTLRTDSGKALPLRASPDDAQKAAMAWDYVTRNRARWSRSAGNHWKEVSQRCRDQLAKFGVSADDLKALAAASADRASLRRILLSLRATLSLVVLPNELSAILAT